MSTADRVVFLLLASLVAVGPTLITRTVGWLDPQLAVALAWERAEGGALVADDTGPVRVDGQLVSDSWGYPLHREWRQRTTTYPFPTVIHRWDSCALEVVTRSVGPDGEAGSVDDVVVRDLAEWPAQPRFASSPRALTLIGVTYLGLAWFVLRSRRSGRLAADAAIAAFVALPVAPVAFALGTTALMARLTTPLVLVPPSFAVPVSAWLLALLLAFAVRVTPRPEAPTWPVTGDTCGA